MVALPIKSKDVARLDAAQNRIGRRLLGRHGYRRVQGDNRDLDVTDDTVRRKLRLCHLAIVLRQRRLCCFHGVVKNRKHQVLAVLLGRGGCDGKWPVDVDPPIGPT